MGIIFAGLDTINIVRGTRWDDNVTLVDQATGNPVDLTGITGLVMRLRRGINAAIDMELSMANGRLVLIDAALGVIGLRVPSAITLTLPELGNRRAKYLYDAVIERTAGEYEAAIKGKVNVQPSVTRPWGST